MVCALHLGLVSIPFYAIPIYPTTLIYLYPLHSIVPMAKSNNKRNTWQTK